MATRLEERLLEPISTSHPGGVDLRYATTPVLREIREARVEVDLPHADGTREFRPADHRRVIQLTSDILATQSKDLQVAAWLTESLLRRDGFSGLAAGLDLIRSLLDSFWDHLYPQVDDDDLEARSDLLAWLGEQLIGAVRLVPLNQSGHHLLDFRESRQVGYEEAAEGDLDRLETRQALLDGGKLAPEEFDSSVRLTPKTWYRALVADIDLASAALDALDRAADDRFGREAPSFTRLREAVREVRGVAGQLLAKKLQADPDPVAAPEAAAEPGAGAPVPTPAAPPAAPVDAASRAPSPAPLGSREAAEAQVTAALAYLRRQGSSDPAPYLALRGLRWGELRAGGDRVDPRMLAAPALEARVRLKTLLLDGRWPELLEAAEEVMATAAGRGWLDLQRYTLAACDALGPEYAAAAAAIRGALRALLADLPELAGATLMDDSPAANAETLAWLRNERLFSTNSTNGGPAGEAPPVPAPAVRLDAVGQAQRRARQGQPEAAVQLLLREAAREESARARFLLRAEAAAILVESGLEGVAMPILRELVEQVEKHHLEEWETGPAVAQPLGLLYRCLTRLEDDADVARALYLRVCRLDPLQGIRLGVSAPDDGEGGDE